MKRVKSLILDFDVKFKFSQKKTQIKLTLSTLFYC